MSCVKQDTTRHTMYLLHLPLQTTHSGHDFNEWSPKKSTKNELNRISAGDPPLSSPLQNSVDNGDIQVVVDPDTMEVMYSYGDRMGHVEDHIKAASWVETVNGDYIPDHTQFDDASTYDMNIIEKLQEPYATNDSLLVLPMDIAEPLELSGINSAATIEDAREGLLKAMSYLQCEAPDAHLHILSLWAVLKYLSDLDSVKNAEKLVTMQCGHQPTTNQHPCSHSDIPEGLLSHDELHTKPAMLVEDGEQHTVCIDWEVVDSADLVTHSVAGPEAPTSHSSEIFAAGPENVEGVLSSTITRSMSQEVDNWGSEIIGEDTKSSHYSSEIHAAPIEVSFPGEQHDYSSPHSPIITMVLLPSFESSDDITSDSLNNFKQTSGHDGLNSAPCTVGNLYHSESISCGVVPTVGIQNVLGTGESYSSDTKLNKPTTIDGVADEPIIVTSTSIRESSEISNGLCEGEVVSSELSTCDVSINSDMIVTNTNSNAPLHELGNPIIITQSYSDTISSTIVQSQKQSGKNPRGIESGAITVKDMLQSKQPAISNHCNRCNELFTESRFLVKHMRNHHIKYGQDCSVKSESVSDVYNEADTVIAPNTEQTQTTISDTQRDTTLNQILDDCRNAICDNMTNTAMSHAFDASVTIKQMGSNTVVCGSDPTKVPPDMMDVVTVQPLTVSRKRLLSDDTECVLNGPRKLQEIDTDEYNTQ